MKNIIDVAFGLHDESNQQHISKIDLFQDYTILVAAPDHPLAALINIGLERNRPEMYHFSNKNNEEQSFLFRLSLVIIIISAQYFL